VATCAKGAFQTADAAPHQREPFLGSWNSRFAGLVQPGAYLLAPRAGQQCDSAFNLQVAFVEMLERHKSGYRRTDDQNPNGDTKWHEVQDLG
jgi:hypothetical protein